MEPLTKSLFYIDNQNSTSFFKSFLAGGSAGTIALCLTAPIERIKIILQVQNYKQTPCKGIIGCSKYIYKSQGLLSFWRGNLANIIRIFPTSSFNFAFKEKYKNYFLHNVDKNTQFWRYCLGNMMSGGMAGISCLALVYPLDFARTRLGADIGRGGKPKFNGIVDCLSKIYISEGIRGVYRGFAVSATGIIVYRSTYFGLYDTVSEAMLTDGKVPILKRMAIAQSVVIVSGLISYPFDTVRRRMMMQSGVLSKEVLYKDSLECWYKIAKYEGLKGFFKGAISNIYVGIGSAIILVLYDDLRNLIS